jgi:aryl-alcohol dehydrogenase-like predicted oxidoreductase
MWASVVIFELRRRKLGVDAIDLSNTTGPTGGKRIGEVMEHFKTLQQEGKIKAIVLSSAPLESAVRLC